MCLERKKLIVKILESSQLACFDDDLALKLFAYQFEHNPLYREYCVHLGRKPSTVHALKDIPFLPIQFFKSHEVKCQNVEHTHYFQSSGTTGMQRSKHWLVDSNLYQQVAIHAFEQHYGPLNSYVILALLPSYLEQGHSSLVHMVQQFIDHSRNKLSGFFLDNHLELIKRIDIATQQDAKIILWGVSYALLDLMENSYFMPNPNLMIMETGGMKGRRKEMVKEELHLVLQKGFGVDAIHSEYGMTELLSQAYSSGHGIFKSSATMKILIRDTNDPLSIEPIGKSGGINVIDLANIDSCCFIATQDLGKLHNETEFEVLGRFDNSDVRGCNLMVV
jgi:phenylacetate-coenzyme A ligase PaaK-like adenylate-forming protein